MAGTINTCVQQSMNKLEKVTSYSNFGMESCLNTVTDVVEIHNDTGTCNEDSKKVLKELENLMLEFCSMDQDLKTFAKAFGEISQAEKGQDGELDYEKILDKKLEDMASNQQLIPKDHEKYMELVDSIKDALNQEAEPEPETEEYAGGEIEVTQTQVQTKCPITGKEMVDPVKNSKCGHKYDREGILNHIKQRKGRAKCPIGGCANASPIQEEHLEVDKELKKYIDRKNRQSRRPKK